MLNRFIPTGDFFLNILLAFVPVIVFLLLLCLIVWLVDRSQFSGRKKVSIFRWSVWLIGSLVIGLVASVLWLVWPEVRSPAQMPRPTRIDTAQELATLVFSQYDTGKPICIIPVTNRVNTYLLLFSGTELKAPTQATHVTSDLLAALSISFFDIFKDRAKQALRDFQTPNGSRIDGANLIIAGHSLGGMEAENLVADATFARRYHIVRLITFGKPKTRTRLSDIGIARHFLLTDDPVVKWVDRFLFFVGGQSPGTVMLAPTPNSLQSEHSNYPVSETLKSYDGMGDLIGTGQIGTFLLLDVSNGTCFGADNPQIYCTPQVHTYGCNPL